MKRNLFFTLLFAVTMQSCISRQVSEGGKYVAEQMGAADYSVGIESTMSSDKGSAKVLSLTLTELRDSLKDLPIDELTSFAAMKLYKHSRQEALKGVDSIKIIVTNNNKTGEVAYAVKDLSGVESYFKTVKDFHSNAAAGRDIKSMFDTTYISRSELDTLNKVETTASRHSGRDKLSFSGFRFSTLEQDSKPVIVIWAIRHKEGMEDIRYTFGILRANHKIVYYRRM